MCFYKRTFIHRRMLTSLFAICLYPFGTLIEMLIPAITSSSWGDLELDCHSSSYYTSDQGESGT